MAPEVSIYYQEMPARLRKAFIFGLIGLALGGALMFAARGIHILFWMYLILTAILLLALAYNTLYVIALRQPMLTLTPRFLIYRKVSIPWEVISGVTELKTPGGITVGILLRDGTLRVTPKDSTLIPRPSMGFLLRNNLAKYGAISIPQAREMTTEQLRHEIERYRESAFAEAAPSAGGPLDGKDNLT